MKKYGILILICISLITSCDIVDHPELDYGINYREDLYGVPPVFNWITNPQQNVLIEDFTGHDCGNCPDAHVVADEILAAHPGRVSVLAIHAGPLAEPLLPDFPADFRTPEGEFYFEQLSVPVNPIGRINRVGGAGNIWTFAQWPNETISQLAESPKVVLQMEAEVDSVLGNLNVHVYNQWFSDQAGAYNLVVLISESGIISPQLEYVPEAIIHEDYEHNHMLRGSVSGTDGLVMAGNPSAGDTGVSSYTYAWNDEWDWHNCSVVAFVVSVATGEVLNVVEKALDE